MQMIFCPNCGSRSGFKRALGFGTFFMVLITIGLWLLMIPFYPVRCINCGLTRASANWENAGVGGKLFIVCMWACIVLFVLHAMRDNTPASQTDQSTAALPVLNPHESRLAELRKKQEGIDTQIYLERAAIRKTLRDQVNAQDSDFPETYGLPDDEAQRVQRLLDEKKAIDAEIATEEGRQQQNEEHPPQQADTSTPLPAVAADKPTSGVLCNGTIGVPQNGLLTFRNLPADPLRFTFDPGDWEPTISQQPDGTQTLVMRSIRPGTQTRCDMRWEIIQ